MQPTDDGTLLREYAERRSDEAFAALVKRHVNLVYSVALRCVGDPHLAEEVSQGVFIILAKKSAELRHDKALSSWLFQTTRLTASNVVRSEIRRQHREQEAHMQSKLNEPEGDIWPRIEPFLDDAVAALSETDRHAIVLRFYEGRSLREVAEALGASEEAAGKRVSRAVERLRGFFARRGVTVGASGLMVVLSANAVQAAPLGLAVTISSASALAGTSFVATAATTTTQIIAMTTLQKTLVVVTIAVLAGTGVYEVRQGSQLRQKIQALEQQQSPLTEQLAKFQAENERLSNQVAQSATTRALSEGQFNELLRLRGKSTVAQTDAAELARLKSAVADQNGRMPDYLTNAMAMGMGVAEKSKMKSAQARLDHMKQALNLSEDQAQAIGDIMQRHIQRQSQMAMGAMTGKMTPEQRLAMVAEGSNQDDEFKALLSPQQLAAYTEFLQAEKTAGALKSANSEAGRIAEDFSLPKEQQERIQAALYEMRLKEKDSKSDKAKTGEGNGNLDEVVSAKIEQFKSQLDEKLKVLGGLLTPEQMKVYREEQQKQLDTISSALKMIVLPKPTQAGN